MITTARYQLAAIILGAIFGLTGCQSDEKQALDYLESARQYYADKQYALATVEIKNAIRKDSSLAEPYLLQSKIFEIQKEWEAMHAFLATTLQQQPKHVEANIEIAKLYAKGRNIVTAQRHLDTALEGGVDQFEKHLVQGMIYMNDQKIEQAMEQARAALTITPSSIDASILSATLSVRLENYKQALNTTNKALAKHPDSDSLLLMKSKIYSVQGQFAEAASYVQKLTSAYPKELSYYYLLAALHDRAGDKKEAEQALQNATKTNPENPKAKIALAGYISQQDKNQAAIDLLSLYIESKPTNGNEELRLILAELLQKQGQINQARDVYKNLTNADNKFALTAKNKLALIALKENRQEDALNILDDVLNTDFGNTEALITRSIIYLSSRRTNQAITDLLSAIRESPNSELALMLLSRAYKQNNNNELAMQTLQKLLASNPTHEEATIQYSQLLYSEKNYKLAIDILQKHSESTTPSPIIRQNLMNVYLANSNWEKAKNLSLVIAKETKQPEYTDYTEAIILQLTNKLPQSTRLFKSLIKRNLFVQQSLKAIAHNYRQLNKASEGIQYITAYSNNNPTNLFAITLLVSEYRRDQQFILAEKSLSNALKNNKEWSTGHLQLAKLYAAQAKWKSAIASGQQALSKSKGQYPIDILLLLASSYEQTDNAQQAEHFYREALKQSPNIHSAANNLSLLLAGDGTDTQRLDEAFQIAKRFEQSKQPAFIDTLGWIYFLRKDYRKAIILLEKAAFDAPNEAEIQYHLGATLLELSETEKARQHLQKSLELNTKQKPFKGHQQAKKLLEKLTL